MSNNTDLIYSPDAAMARYFYYDGLNSVNIFVEDSGKEYEYETIFQRLLGENSDIFTIFAVGGKENIKAAYTEYGLVSPANPNIKNIYIADGDFDRLIHAEDMIINEQFIYLDAYNIENYFIDEKATLQYVKGKLKCSTQEVRERMAFSDWERKIVDQSFPLFLCYCMVQQRHPTQQNVARKPFLFLDHLTGFSRDNGYKTYFDFVATFEPNAQEYINIISADFCALYGENKQSLICGKFLLDSLAAYVRSVISATLNKDEFRWHLICNFDITKLYYLRDRISAVLLAA